MILSFMLILMMIGMLILQLLGAASVMVARGAMWN
jgi:hypothetical protein